MDFPEDDLEPTPIERVEDVLRDIRSELREINRNVGSLDLRKVGKLLSEISHHLQIEMNTDKIINIPQEIRVELDPLRDEMRKSTDVLDELNSTLAQRMDTDYPLWLFIITILLATLVFLHMIEMNTDQIINIPQEIWVELDLLRDEIRKSANTLVELYSALT